MPIKVPSQEDVTFEAFVRGSGERITINNEELIRITPSANPDQVNVLRLPELIGKFLKMTYIHLNTDFLR